MGVAPHAPRVCPVDDRGMDAVPLRISIEVDRGPGPLRGRVHEPGSVHEFEGWLGLLGVLGNAIDPSQDREAPGAP